VTPRQPVVSGAQFVKALERDGWPWSASAEATFGSRSGRRTALVVPLRKELRKGTLAGILRDADLGAVALRRLLG
jgi:predicted RNA binding protein YcfA (HicA-like mRNA interferase family)